MKAEKLGDKTSAKIDLHNIIDNAFSQLKDYIIPTLVESL